MKIIELNLELNPLGRLGIAIRLVRVFAFMHNSPIGKRINCDMTKVTRALSLVYNLKFYSLIYGTCKVFFIIFLIWVTRAGIMRESYG